MEATGSQVNWTLARTAAYSRIKQHIRALLGDALTPEEFERKFLDDRHAVIDASSNGGLGADYDFEEVVDEIWLHVDAYLPSSLGMVRDDDQTDEAEFVARVRAEWERYQGQRPT